MNRAVQFTRQAAQGDDGIIEAGGKAADVAEGGGAADGSAAHVAEGGGSTVDDDVNVMDQEAGEEESPETDQPVAVDVD